MRHFILRGLIPQPTEGGPLFGGTDPATRAEKIDRWKSTGRPLPKEGQRTLLHHPQFGRLSVLVHDVYDALLLVSASSQEKAYAIASPFRAFATIYLGTPPGESPYEFLLELRDKPSPTYTSRDIACLYRQLGPTRVDPDLLSCAIRTGTVLPFAQIQSACDFVKRAAGNPRLVSSLLHLEQSHDLFAGHMTSSYYHYHYRRDRRAESRYLRRKRYLEERTVYDLAFLSAFRALEALLGTTQIKKNEIQRRVNELDAQFGTSFATGRWRSFHEFFSSKRRWWTFEKLISRYLLIRNAVAAHANLSPPFLLQEDQVLEIQRMVEHMLYKATGKANA